MMLCQKGEYAVSRWRSAGCRTLMCGVVVIFAVWITSVWIVVMFQGRGWCGSITNGVIKVAIAEGKGQASGPRFHMTWACVPDLPRESFAGFVLPTISQVVCISRSESGRVCVVPLWIPAVILCVTCILLAPWRSGDVRAGRCKKCGYDVRENTSGICPECGTPIPQDAREPPATKPAKNETCC